MFYSENILAKRGPLAKVWLAAHWERKLSKSQFLQTNIPLSISAIVEDYGQPMALRLSGQLLLGVVRIFSRKTRYLLEDCSEALVKIKMAFRPGVVDLTDEQAVAASGLITVNEAINEFDILMPDPEFDLDALMNTVPSKLNNTSRLQDITLQPDYLSFSQQIPDDLDQSGARGSMIGSERDITMEVGRDAYTGREFTPGLDVLSVAGSVREKSVGPGNDPLMMNNPSFELGLNDANELDFNFDMPNMDFDMGPNENDLPPLDFDTSFKEQESRDSEITVPNLDLEFKGLNNSLPLDESMVNDNEKPEKYKRKGQAVKKRKRLVDEKIELQNARVPDNSLLNGKENFAPLSRYMEQKMPVFRLEHSKFDWLPQASMERQILKSISNGTSHPPIDSQVSNLQNDASFQYNDDFGDMPDFDVSRISDHPTPKKQKTNGEESIHANFDESIVFGEQSKEDNIFDFDISPENAEGGIDSDAGMSTNTIKTLSVLKEKISESTEKTVTFSDLAQSAPRAVAAKLFFELLVLKTKDAITVSQETAFGEIEVGII